MLIKIAKRTSPRFEPRFENSDNFIKLDYDCETLSSPKEGTFLLIFLTVVPKGECNFFQSTSSRYVLCIFRIR